LYVQFEYSYFLLNIIVPEAFFNTSDAPSSVYELVFISCAEYSASFDPSQNIIVDINCPNVIELLAPRVYLPPTPLQSVVLFTRLSSPKESTNLPPCGAVVVTPFTVELIL
jgi:hypothetical protein